MPGRVLYKVRHKDTSGNWVATHTHWRRLSYVKRLNRAGGAELNLGYKETIEDDLDLDSLLEIWRKYPGGTWYEEFPVLHRNLHRRIEADGDDVMTSYSRGLLDLIARRVILGFSKTSYTKKGPGQAETLLKQLVDEQAVSGAIFRDIAGLSVEADGAGGNSIEFARAYKNLLEVLQEFAGDVGGGDVGVETNGAAQWIFKWYDGQLGGDKTWGNGAGNPPVVFSLGFGNMRLPTYGFVRTDEINSVHVGGTGTGTARTVVNRTDATAIAASPLNRLEAFRSSRSSDTAELQDIGDTALQDLQARRTFKFSVIQTDTTRYGDHYELGDKVTVRFGSNIELNRRIVGVSVVIDRSGEDVKLEMDDVP